MPSYEVTQKLIALAATYEVHLPGSDQVLMTVKGRLLATPPKLTMCQGGEGGPEVGRLEGNFWKTKFRILMPDGSEVGRLTFPFLAFRKTFTLTVGGIDYAAEGGYAGWAFRCRNPDGVTIFEITKQLALRDKFQVDVAEGVSPEVAVLAAIAIDQRLFQQ